MPNKSLRLLIIGATSTIAQEVCRLYALRNAHFLLVARSPEKLVTVKQDLLARGAGQVAVKEDDFAGEWDAQAILQECLSQLGGLDILLVAHGMLADQNLCEQDEMAFTRAWQINFQSAALVTLRVASYLEEQGQGIIAVISSVAGDRGRQSNYIYGAAKAALSSFLQGLRSRCYKAGVHVITIKPGFVDTAMTQALDKNFLYASPADVGQSIVKGIDKRRDVIYVPYFWWWIMLIIKLIPEKIFKRLNL